MIYFFIIDTVFHPSGIFQNCMEISSKLHGNFFKISCLKKSGLVAMPLFLLDDLLNSYENYLTIPISSKILPHGFEAFLAHFDGQPHGLGQLLERTSLDPHHLELGLPNKLQPHEPLYRHT